jgi:hypothetical protein
MRLHDPRKPPGFAADNARRPLRVISLDGRVASSSMS